MNSLAREGHFQCLDIHLDLHKGGSEHEEWDGGEFWNENVLEVGVRCLRPLMVEPDFLAI